MFRSTFSATLLLCLSSAFHFVSAEDGQIVTERQADQLDATHKKTDVRLRYLGHYESGIYRQSASEIVAYDSRSQRAFVVNAFSGKVDVLNMTEPSAPKFLYAIDVSDVGSDANSVAIHEGLIAIAVQARVKTDPGFVAFYDSNGKRQAVVEVGCLPDAVTFSPDGRFLLVANEGEPNDDYSIDPDGSVSIIDVSLGLKSLAVKTASFSEFNYQSTTLQRSGIRIFGPGATVAQDLEPEWIDVSADSSTAYVSLQENNAIAIVDVPTATVRKILPLGFKDWSREGQWSGKGLDTSDRDGGIQIRNWPVFGIFQPDTIRVLEVDGETYLVGACEGDARPWGVPEEIRVSELQLDPIVFPAAADLQADENLGRLLVTSDLGAFPGGADGNGDSSDDGNGLCKALYAFGGRSMAIWQVHEDSLELIFDSGSQIEETVAEHYPNYFNADHEDRATQLDRRSGSKGPEPEGLALGRVADRTYAFVGLERVGGIVVYDVTDPAETKFVEYLNPRDFSTSENAEAEHFKNDLGPEGLCFVPASSSPDAEGRPLLIVGHEVSGTTAVLAVEIQSKPQ